MILVQQILQGTSLHPECKNKQRRLSDTTITQTSGKENHYINTYSRNVWMDISFHRNMLFIDTRKEEFTSKIDKLKYDGVDNKINTKQWWLKR